MKNIMSYLIVILSLFSYQLAQAKSCEDTSPVKLSTMKFLDKPVVDLLSEIGRRDVIAGCTVIDGVNTDNAANAKCKYAAINPGNPQYTGKNAGYGTTGTNKIGYYFCMNFNKEAMCNHMKGKIPGVDVRYTGPVGSRNKGDCLCKPTGSSQSEEIECPANSSDVKVANNCPVPGSVMEGGKCVCQNDKSITVTGTAVVCPTRAEPVVSATATVSPDEIDECVADLRAAKELCSSKGQDAINKCSKDAPEVNKSVTEAQRVLGIGLDALIAKNAGTGALDACTRMSTLGTGVLEALSFLKQNCQKQLNACKQGCEDVKSLVEKSDEDYIKECEAKFAASEKRFSSEHRSLLITTLAVEKQQTGGADDFCKSNVEFADSQFGDFLDKLATSVQKADICRCQLTAASINPETCESIVTPLTCIENPNAKGCSMSTVGCAPNSTIGGCKLNANPTQVAGSGVRAPISGFASPGIGSGGSGGLASGKATIDTSGLDGLYDDTRPSASATATADAGSPFGAAQSVGAGGAGGGGGGGGGDGEGGGGDGEGDGKGGLSAFFQNAKGSIANMFGGSTGDRGAAAKKGNNKAYKNDVNGFRPKAAVRGMANSNEFGSKNRDIWKIMNERYTDQYHTFITVENPSK